MWQLIWIVCKYKAVGSILLDPSTYVEDGKDISYYAGVNQI